MKRTINLRALLILSVTGLCLGAGVFLVHGLQVQRNILDVLEQAAQAEAAGQPDQAVERLGCYLGLEPGDTNVLARFGLLRKDLARTPRQRVEAFLVLEKVLRLDGSREDVRREVVKLALDLGRSADAKKHLDILQQAAPDDAEVEALLGRCALGEGDPALAASWFAKAIQHAPDRIDNYVRRADVLRHRLAKPADADATIQALIDANPRSAAARLTAARYRLGLGSLDAAEHDVQVALTDLGAQEPEAFLLAAEVAEARGATVQCRERLQRGLAKHPGSPQFNLALARLEARQGRRPEAQEHLRRSLRELPSKPEEQAQLSDLLVDAGLVTEAGTIMERLRSSGAVAAADYVRASILVHQGTWGQARTLLEGPSLRGPEWVKPANLLLAQCHEQLCNPDGQLAAYRRALLVEPQLLPAHIGQAALLARLGKIDEAIEAYRTVLPRAPELGVPLVRLLIRRNLRLPPESRNWTEAEQVLARLPEAPNHAVDVCIVRAEVLMARDKPDEARAVLETGRDDSAHGERLWLARIGLAIRQGKRDDALTILDDAEKKRGPHVEFTLTRIQLAVHADAVEPEQALRKLEPVLDQFNDAARDRLLNAFADAYQRTGNIQAAVHCWTQLAQRKPTDLTVRVALLEVALRGGAEAQTQRLLAEIKQIEGEGPLWCYGEASRLLTSARPGDKAPLTQARRRLAAATAQQPTWSALPLLEARIDEREGNTDQALEKYQRVLELGVRDPAVIRRIVDLLYQKGRFIEAQTVMRKLPEQALTSPDIRRRGAELSLLNGNLASATDQQRALDLARQAVPADSKDYREYLWLGQVALAAGQPEQAEQMLRRSTELAGKAPEPWVALVLYWAQKDRRQAETILAEAQRRLGPDVALTVFAPCHEALGQLDKARACYEAALTAKPNDPAAIQGLTNFYARNGQGQQAEDYWRKMIRSDSPAPEGAQLWARRQLALSLAASGGYPQYREALVLVERNLQSARRSRDDERVQALVVATQPGRRREAVALFERLAKGQSLNAQEQFLLAQLYEDSGNWSEARPLLLGLLGAQGKNPLYLARYAQALLKRGDGAEAAVWVEKLAAVEPEAFRTWSLKARVLKQRDRTAEAVRCVREFGDGHPEHLAALAALLAEMGQGAEAEKMYRENVARSGRPDGPLLLAQHLGKQDRVAEALELCEGAWRSCPPEIVASASVAVLRNGQPTEQQFRALERRIAAAAAEKPRAAVFPLLLAELHARQGRYAEAMQVHRKVLQQDPHNVLAMNNLAWLLALKDGNGAEAVALLHKAIDIAGPEAHFLDTRAVAYLTINETRRALDDLNEVVLQAPTPQLYFHLARAHHLAKDRGAALGAMRKAKEMGLAATALHPLERDAYQRLTQDLDLR